MKLASSLAAELRRRFVLFMDYVRMSETTYITILACLVGVLGGVGAVGLWKLILFFQYLAIGGGSEGVVAALQKLPWYTKVAIPVIGSALVGPLVYYGAREAKGHGVPEVMYAIALKNGVIRARVAIVKIIASAITIATGGSVGREGPIVQIGAGFGSTLGQWLRLSPERMRVLVGCGAAAGVAAAFNAPIAGAFFALEVVLGNFSLPSFGPIIVSSVLATAVSRGLLGDELAFTVPEYSLVSAWEIPLYALLGIVTGCLAVGYSISVYKAEDSFDKLRIPEPLKTPLGGLLLGGLIVFVPHVYGVGYEAIDAALRGELFWRLALVLLAAKLLATAITLGSGGSGGIFAPALFLGAVSGSLFGNLANRLFPGITADSGAYALVGMGAVVGAATHAPITAILILFEMTGDYQIILGLMIACTIATTTAKKLYKESIYTVKLSRRGVSLNQGREEIIMKSFTVGDVMKTEVPAIRENASFNEIVKAFMETQEPNYYVTNDADEFLGMLSTHTIKSVFDDVSLQHLVIARDLLDPLAKTVTIGSNLAECMDIFCRVESEHLPVVGSEDPPRLVGTVSRRDILELYNREILRKDVLALKYVRDLGQDTKRSHVTLPSEYEVDYVPLPSGFVGKTVGELDVRVKHGVTIVAVKRRAAGVSASEIPSPQTAFSNGDILIVVGRGDDVERFRRIGKG